MRKNIFNSEKNKIYMLGIGGISMSGLAKHLSECGYTVSGCDLVKTSLTDDLERLGIKVNCGNNCCDFNCTDALIYTSAIEHNNQLLKKAQKNKVPIYSRSQLLGKILSGYKKTIAISGSHGKTTATAMIADAVILAGLDPTVFLGGESVSYGNYRNGGENVAIAEACEYKKSFLDIKPDISVVLNIDNDHLDCYKDMDELCSSFGKFISGSISVINADDNRAVNISNMTSVSFGINNLAVYSAQKIKFNGIGYSFTAHAFGLAKGRVNLKVLGKHNIYNALATIAVCDQLRIPFYITKNALENFCGVKRRCEYIGDIDGLECFCDYAHHPKEILATINAFNEQSVPYALVFQPHTYSRTKNLMQDFIQVLSQKELVAIYKTYPARESFDNLGDGKTLYENLLKSGKNTAFYIQNEQELKDFNKKVKKEYKRIIFLGAGDIYDIAKSLK